MVFEKDEERKSFSTIARILEMTEGRGRALGQKMSVKLKYLSSGKVKTDTVDFWNAPKKSLPQLYDQIRGYKIGDIICVTIRLSDKKTRYATQFTPLNGFLSMRGKYYYIGKIVNLAKRKQNQECIADFGVHNLSPTVSMKWNVLSFLVKEPQKFTFKKDDIFIAECKQPTEKMLPNGCPIYSFEAAHIAPLNKEIEILMSEKETSSVVQSGSVQKESDEFRYDLSMLPDAVINIGVYAGDNGTTVHNILRVPDTHAQRVVAWMTYVADEWQPEKGNDDLAKQKKIITACLVEVTKQDEARKNQKRCS